ncbi:MAG: Hsp20/alpha crystallin family protein [Bacillota bacterium]|nr:Hsp20/alpha crystallin family protein [Bacillota bacterium]
MRDLIRRANNNEMDRIRSGIDSVFADAFFRNWPSGGQGAFPPVDLFNTEGSLVALINLPGVDINEVEVTTNNDTLTISGEIKFEVGEGELLWQERTGGKFYRSFKLPVPIKADSVDASYKAGVLRIEMPKIDELKSRTIKIKEAK